MEGTPEGLALAQAVRETARKRAAPEQGSSQPADGASPPAKKPAVSAVPRVRPPCTHEVALPDGFDKEGIKLDPAIFGEDGLPLSAASSISDQAMPIGWGREGPGTGLKAMHGGWCRPAAMGMVRMVNGCISVQALPGKRSSLQHAHMMLMQLVPLEYLRSCRHTRCTSAPWAEGQAVPLCPGPFPGNSCGLPGEDAELLDVWMGKVRMTKGASLQHGMPQTLAWHLLIVVFHDLLLQERRESVLVAAHTSAGKTVVAE